MTDQARGTSTGLILKLVRWAAFAACVALFVHALAKSDLASAWERIRGIGPLAFVGLLPFAAVLGIDAWAWQRLLAALDRKIPWLTLFKVRIATEAVTNSAPAGALWADAIAPILVTRRASVPIADVFASSTAKRWTVVRMHAAYVGLAAAFGASALQHASRQLLGNDALLVLILASAATLALLSYGIEAIAARGKIAARISSTLDNPRFRRVKAWVETRHHHFAHADAQLARLSDDKRASTTASWRLLGLWLLEGLETFLLLRLLGAPLSLVEVLSFDAALSVVRSSAMFAPAGIGVQDVGYLAVLEAYGVPDAASLGPAFVVLKRMKEAVWIGLGFIVLARTGKPREVMMEAVEEVARHSLPETKPAPPQPPPAAT